MIVTSPSMVRPVLRAAAVAAAVSMIFTACGEKKADAPASQTAVKVNKEELTVHQINLALQGQRGLKPEQVDAASKVVLERLIDQELAVQKAGELKLDRDARVVQQIEAARRDIISRAYLQKISEGASKPSTEEVKKYYDENAALFSNRRIYQLQEIGIEAKPEQIDGLRAQLKSSKNVNDFLESLKAGQIRFTTNQGVRGAEQLPLSALGSFAAMKDGESRLAQTPNGAQVIVLLNSKLQPVSLENARPVIETFLLNERKRKIIGDDIKALRAGAKIDYVGKFEPAASAAAGAAAASAAKAAEAAAAPVSVLEAPASAGSAAIDAATITKGLGLK